MSKWIIVAVGALFASGCAGGGQANTGADDADLGASLEIVASNEGASTVTLFAQWEFGRSVRLGDLPPGRTRTFETPLRGQGLIVTFGAVGARRGSSSGGLGFVPVLLGERVEWTLNISGRAEVRIVPAL